MARSSSFVYVALLVLYAVARLKSAKASNHNVLSFGASPLGVVDSTQGFLHAWAAACGTPGSHIIYVPKGRYLIGPLRFEGEKCKSSRITLRIDGTLVGPMDYNVLGGEENWLSFKRVAGVSIIGGALDAKGPKLWDCKANGGKRCPEGATTLGFEYCSDVSIKDLLSLNSQMFHIVVNHCQNVRMEGVRIIAADQSPNTDGIHVQLSKDIKITNTSIKTGDDCISIGPGTKNLWVERVTCGPGHGISIGSLAKDAEEKGVQNVTVKKTVFVGSDNGLRIKSWGRPTTGFVRRVRFLGAKMINVRYPILIDQNYCPHDINCPGEGSGAKIQDVIYQGIRGTSATKVAVKMDCSSRFPCRAIRMRDIDLTYSGTVAESECTNVVGKALGLVQPDGCF